MYLSFFKINDFTLPHSFIVDPEMSSFRLILRIDTPEHEVINSDSYDDLLLTIQDILDNEGLIFKGILYNPREVYCEPI